MDVHFTLFSCIFVLAITCGFSLADSADGNVTLNTSSAITLVSANQTGMDTASDESLLNLAREGQAYALENGKMAALSAFSDRSTFVRDGMYITAYTWKGELLADPYQGDKIGTACITDDHDAGIVRQLRDLAQAGGGILSPGGSGNGTTYYALKVDGSWWIAAASAKPVAPV